MSEVPRFPDLLLLIADQSVHMRRIVRDVVSRAGIKRIVEASDGAEAIELFSTAIPNLMIIDWDMPMLTGEEFVRLVRTPATSPAPKVPIIMLTGNPQKNFVEKAIALGVNDVVIKPFSPKSLWQRMDQIIRYPREFNQVGSIMKPGARLPMRSRAVA
jgi:two-component system, chemotaxis family, chemotaxis protein CheY